LGTVYKDKKEFEKMEEVWRKGALLKDLACALHLALYLLSSDCAGSGEEEAKQKKPTSTEQRRNSNSNTNQDDKKKQEGFQLACICSTAFSRAKYLQARCYLKGEGVTQNIALGEKLISDLMTSLSKQKKSTSSHSSSSSSSSSSSLSSSPVVVSSTLMNRKSFTRDDSDSDECDTIREYLAEDGLVSLIPRRFS
jgi:hypothetical protein